MSEDDEQLALELASVNEVQEMIDRIQSRFRRDHPDRVIDQQRGDRLHG